MKFLDFTEPDCRVIWNSLVLFLKKEKNDLEADSENIRAATSSTGPQGRTVYFCFRGRPPPSVMAEGHRLSRGLDTAMPVGLGGGTLNQRELFSIYKILCICLAEFWTCVGPITSSFFPIPCRIGVSLVCLSHPCMLEASNLSASTGSQLERNFTSG